MKNACPALLSFFFVVFLPFFVVFFRDILNNSRFCLAWPLKSMSYKLFFQKTGLIRMSLGEGGCPVFNLSYHYLLKPEVYIVLWSKTC
jgi:hypothetical protein